MNQDLSCMKIIAKGKIKGIEYGKIWLELFTGDDDIPEAPFNKAVVHMEEKEIFPGQNILVVEIAGELRVIKDEMPKMNRDVFLY